MSNTECQKITSGTIMGDVKFGFSAVNFGCNIIIKGANNQINVTWKELLCAGKDAIQVFACVVISTRALQSFIFKVKV